MGMSDYTERGAVPVEDAAVHDPPTVDEVIRKHNADQVTADKSKTDQGTADHGDGERRPVPDSGPAAGSDEVQGVVQAVLAAASRTGRTTAAGLATAVEGAARALTRRGVASAIADPRPVADTKDLAEALAKRSGVPSLSSATAAALATRVARRAGPLRFLARRTPMWIAAVAIPALYASIGRGAEELTLVASHLVSRVRAAGLEPDPDRVHEVAVRLLNRSGPDAEASSGALVSRWVRRAAKSALPFASGVRTPDPEGIATEASRVPVHELATNG